jgi:hypothetical protein
MSMRPYSTDYDVCKRKNSEITKFVDIRWGRY